MKKLSLEDQINLNWLIDMHHYHHNMTITSNVNCLGEHTVCYDDGATKSISHDCWCVWQTQYNILVYKNRNPHNEIIEMEEEFYDAIDGDINNITGYFFDQECGDR